MSYIKYNNRWINNLQGGSVIASSSPTISVLSSVNVPANTYQAGDLIELDSYFAKSAALSGTSLYYYWVSGSTPTLSGAIQLSTITLPASNQAIYQSRRLYIRTADGSGTGFNIGTELISPGISVVNDYQSGIVGNVALNWTINSTIFCATLSPLTNVSQWYLKIWEW